MREKMHNKTEQRAHLRMRKKCKRVERRRKGGTLT